MKAKRENSTFEQRVKEWVSEWPSPLCSQLKQVRKESPRNNNSGKNGIFSGFLLATAVMVIHLSSSGREAISETPMTTAKHVYPDIFVFTNYSKKSIWL